MSTPAIDVKSLLSALRSATVGAPANLLRKSVEVLGQSFEVRQPTVTERTDIMRRADAIRMGPDGKPEMGRDFGMLLIHATIACTFIPGTDEKVFSIHDLDVMKNAPTGSYVDILGKAALELINVEGPNMGKPSGETQSAS